MESVIGLEVHAQLSTRSKIFAPSAAESGREPNSLCDPVTLGLPGCLPVLNRSAVDSAIKLGLATKCRINQRNIFARKHYHYPDLPKGYQISQFEQPICEHGSLKIRLESGLKTIGITRIHLEEDAGKNVHLENEPASIVDLNRAGVPLLEIVSEPDLRSAEEAGAYMRLLRQIVRYLEICDGNLEEGSLRCDANISVRPQGEKELGTKVEIKNLNSFRHVEKAIDYEIQRQSSLYAQGKEIVQETRLWDETRGITRSMRSKEYAEDYRYFPDPDLLPLVVDDAWIDSIESGLPELPQDTFNRFTSAYGLETSQAEQLTEEKHVATFFESAVASHDNPSALANWITTELFGKLNREGLSILECPVSPENLAELVRLIDSGVVSGKIAKKVFDEMFQSGASPETIVEQKGLKQLSDPALISDAISGVLELHPEQVAEYRSGKTKVFGFFVGQIMKETKGSANPQLLNKLLKEQLDQD